MGPSSKVTISNRLILVSTAVRASAADKRETSHVGTRPSLEVQVCGPARPSRILHCFFWGGDFRESCDQHSQESTIYTVEGFFLVKLETESRCPGPLLKTAQQSGVLEGPTPGASALALLTYLWRF